MVISPALAGHGVVGTGSSGGGDALLIILGVAIVLGLGYMTWNKWRRRRPTQDGDNGSGSL